MGIKMYSMQRIRAVVKRVLMQMANKVMPKRLKLHVSSRQVKVWCMNTMMRV